MKVGYWAAFAGVVALCSCVVLLQWKYTELTVAAAGRYLFGEAVNNTKDMGYLGKSTRVVSHTAGRNAVTTIHTIRGGEVKGTVTSKLLKTTTKDKQKPSADATHTEVNAGTPGRERTEQKLTTTPKTQENLTKAKVVPWVENDGGKFEYRDPNDPELQKELKRRLQLASEKKYIVDWYQHYPDQKPPRELCGNCEVTRNKTKITDKATGAVLFYFDKIREATMPPNRSLDQLYIYWDHEPPSLARYVRKLDLKFEDRYGFNATMTYRRDSDFHDEIYNVMRIITVLRGPKMTMNDVRAKKKLSISVVSNCGRTAGARLRMKMLQKIKEAAGSDMDALGKCFPESGDVIKNFTKIGDTIQQYKFYFSFENSYHCKDYVTEKVFRNAFYYRAVPVVLGASRADYEYLLPKNSFIYLEDFSSVNKLVEYLRYLDKNDTAYFEYFRWHHMSRGDIPLQERIPKTCFLCRALHGINFDDLFNERYGPDTGLPRPLFDNGVTRRTIKSLSDWFYWSEPPECMEDDETNLPIFKKYGLE